MQSITIHDAIGQAIAEEMRRDPAVMMFGEGVATKRGALVEEFGGLRVRNTPLAEGIIAGAAVLPALIFGQADMSATLRLSTPRTRIAASSTAMRSPSAPIRAVPAGW